MLEIRIVEDAMSRETQRIWEGAVLSLDNIGSRFAIDRPEIVSRLGEFELRVEQKDGSDWIDIGPVEQFLPDVCSIDLINEDHDDIMVGWRIDDDLMWEDHIPQAAFQIENAIREAIVEELTPSYGNVTPIRDVHDTCAYCSSEVASSGDLVCADCLQPASVKLSRYCTDCDGRLQTVSERRSGYCSGCVGYYDIPSTVELMSRYRPFGRLAQQRNARVS